MSYQQVNDPRTNIFRSKTHLQLHSEDAQERISAMSVQSDRQELRSDYQS